MTSLRYQIARRASLERFRERSHGRLRGKAGFLRIGALRKPIAFDLPALTWLGAACVSALVVGVSIARSPTLPATLVPFIVMLMGLALLVGQLYHYRDASIRQGLMRWTLGAFALHFAIGDIIWHVPTLTTYFGGDAFTYNGGGAALAQHWLGNAPMPGLPAGKDGFFYLLGSLYYLFGPHAGAGMAVDAAFAAAMIPLLHDATERQFGPAAARYVPPLCLFIPGFLIWSSQLLREAGIYFGIALALNAAVRLYRRITLGALFTMTCSLVLIFVWRASVGALAAGGFLIAFMFQRQVKNTFASLIMAVAAAALVLGVGLGHDGFTFMANTNFAQINGTRMASATGAASGFLPNSDVASGKHALLYLPIATPLFMFGPFPWNLASGRQLFSIPDVLTWWALLPSLWRGFGEARRRVGRAVGFYWVPAIANALGLSLIIANYGTAVRERMQVIVFLIPLVALGLSLRKGRSSSPESAGTDPDMMPVRMV